jgi:hypothetical protein
MILLKDLWVNHIYANDWTDWTLALYGASFGGHKDLVCFAKENRDPLTLSGPILYR